MIIIMCKYTSFIQKIKINALLPLTSLLQLLIFIIWAFPLANARGRSPACTPRSAAKWLNGRAVASVGRSARSFSH